MYELRIFVKGEEHYATVTEEGLTEFRLNMEDATSHVFVEFFSVEHELTFAINRKEVGLYTYRELAG